MSFFLFFFTHFALKSAWETQWKTSSICFLLAFLIRWNDVCLEPAGGVLTSSSVGNYIGCELLFLCETWKRDKAGKFSKTEIQICRWLILNFYMLLGLCLLSGHISSKSLKFTRKKNMDKSVLVTLSFLRNNYSTGLFQKKVEHEFYYLKL